MNQEINDFLRDSVRNGIFIGCNCVIMNENQFLYYSVGLRSTEPLVKNNLETLYDLASLTKVIATTTAILRLIYFEKLSYDTPVCSIIKAFPNKEITVFHLLTHTSGLPSDTKFSYSSTKMQILNKIFDYSKYSRCYEKVLYSDLGYILLGCIIEKITGMSLDRAISKLVLNELGMNKTCYCPSSKERILCAPTEYNLDLHKLLKGEVHDEKAYIMGGIAGHAGLFSCVEDLSHYMQMILNNGMYNDRVFLPSNLIKDLYTILTPKEEIARGIGYLVFDLRSPFSKLNSNQSFMHTGFTGTSILFDMKYKIGIILLSNRVYPTRNNTQIIEWRRQFHDFVMEQLLK